MIILLARTLTTGITLTVFVKPDASQQKLTALKLSLVNNQYYSLVRFVSEVITNQFDFVISSNAFFEQFMANRVKSSPLIDSENYEAEYSSLYPSTRVIVVIDTPLKAVEK